jgi:DNA polymerase I-like protein with 3'-5' exonuclease and polymerase domains
MKDSKDYVIAKQCLHAANYKMGPDRFAVEAGISRGRANEILGAYYAHYPELQAWHARTREAILQVGKLVTPLGRERIFYHARAEVLLTGTLSAESWRNAIAYVPQATVPDVLNRGMLRTWEDLDYVWLHHQGHDSCLVSVPYDRLGECCERLVANLAIPIPMGLATLVIPVEVTWGRLWNPMLPWIGESSAVPLLSMYDKYVAKHMTYEYVAKEMA